MNAQTTQPDNNTNDAVFPRTSEAHQKADKALTAKQLRKQQMQLDALTKAATGVSVANFKTIFEGFAEMGIPMEEIKPRENVFTFNAWKALGRVVKRGQHGVKVVTVIECTKKDENTGLELPVKKPNRTTVFHISQTEALDGSDAVQTQAPAALSETEQAQNFDVPAAPLPLATEEVVPAERPLNAYELKLAQRKTNYEYRAMSAKSEGDAALSKARRMASVIVFGQPILVGHHSEKRDRNYRNKIHNTFGKGFGLHDKAAYYENKAESVGTGGISSDDPDALIKLREELKQMQKSQDMMKAANKAIRAGKTQESKLAGLVALGLSEANAAKLIEKDFAGRIGFPRYALTNNGANVRRVEKRITELEARRSRADVEKKGNGYEYREDVEENRVMFKFEGKPKKEIREYFGKRAFNWSPNRMAWVRKLSNAALWHAGEVREYLDSFNGDVTE